MSPTAAWFILSIGGLSGVAIYAMFKQPSWALGRTEYGHQLLQLEQLAQSIA